MDFGIKTPDIVGSYIQGQEAAQNNLYKQALMEAQTRQQEQFAQQQKDKTFKNLMQYNLQPKYDKLINDPRITQDQLNAQVAQDFQAYPYLRDYLGDDFRILKNEQAFEQVIPINGQEDLNIILSEGYIDNSHAKLLQNELDQGRMPSVKVTKDFNGRVKVIDVTDERKEAYLKQAMKDSKSKDFTATNVVSIYKGYLETETPAEAMRLTEQFMKSFNPNTRWSSDKLMETIDTDGIVPKASNISNLEIATPSFNTVEEAEAANLDPGTEVIIAGKKYRSK